MHTTHTEKSYNCSMFFRLKACVCFFLTILLPAGSHVYSELLKMVVLAVLVTELDGIVMKSDLKLLQ